MWQLFAVLVLLALMLGMDILASTPGMAGALDPKSLVATGFILLAAFTCGELAKRLRLPALIGYLVAGLLFGPRFAEVLGIPLDKVLFSTHVIDDLALVNILAVGVVGTIGGCEIKTADLRAGGKTLVFVPLLVLGTIIPLITGVVFAIWAWAPQLAPFLSELSPIQVGAAALLFGVLAAGMSPAATVAVFQETQTKGPFSSLVLGIVIVADLLLVSNFLVALAFAKLTLTPEGVTTEAVLHVLPEIGAEFGWALVLGVIAGVVNILYFRFVEREPLLFAIGVIFASSYAAKVLHAEPLLVFITSGFVVQNFSRYGHHLLHAFEVIALPVFVVYFTTQAAGLNLLALGAYLPLAGILVVTRVSMLYGAIRLGSRLAKTPERFGRWLWMCFFSQGGVDLLLASMIAAAIPGWGAEIQTVTIATVIVYLFGGPPLLKAALEGIGESKSARERGMATLETEATAREDAAPGAALLPKPEVEDASLQARLEALRERLDAVDRDLFRGRVGDRVRQLGAIVDTVDKATSTLLDGLDDAIAASDRNLDERVASVARARKAFAVELGKASARLEKIEPSILNAAEVAEFIAALDAMEGFNTSYQVAREEHLFDVDMAGNGYVRLARRLRRWRRSMFGRGTRTVPVGRLWRYHVSLGLPAMLWRTMETPASSMWEELASHLRGLDELAGGVERRLAGEVIDGESDDLAATSGSGVPVVVDDHTSPASGGSALGSGAHGGQATPAPVRNATSGQGRPATGAFAALTASIIGSSDDAEGSGPSGANGKSSGRHEALSPVDRARAYLDRTRPQIESRRAALRDRQSAVQHAYAGLPPTLLVDAFTGFLGAVALAGTAELPAFRYRLSRRFDIAQAAKSELAGRLEREELVADGYRDFVLAWERVQAFAGWFEEHRRAVELAWETRFIRDARARLTGLKDAFEVSGEESAFARVDRHVRPGLQVARSGIAASLALVGEGQFSRALALRLEGRLVQIPRELTPLVPTQNAGRSGKPTRLPLRQWLQLELVVESSLALSEANERLDARLREVLAGLERVDQALDVQLASLRPKVAGRAPGEIPTDVEAELGQSLVRLQRIVGELEAGFESGQTSIAKWLDETLSKLSREALLPIREGRLSVVVRRLAQRQGDVAASGMGRQIAGLRSYATRVREVAASLRPLFRQLRDEVAALFSDGGTTADELEHRRILMSAVDIETRLPSVYRRLYSPSPVEVAELTIPRPLLEGRLREAVQRWRDGAPESILIHGDRGAGKRSLVHRVLAGLQSSETPTHWLRLTSGLEGENTVAATLARMLGIGEVTNFEALARRMKAREQRQVVVVENAERLFKRTADGRDEMQRFLRAMSLGSEKTLWLLLVSSSGAVMINGALGLNEHFDDVVEVGAFSVEDLASLILARHRLSAFALNFERPRIGLLERIFRPFATAQALRDPRAVMFQRLHEASRGNARQAMIYWLTCSRPSEDGAAIVVKPLPRARPRLLAGLGLRERLLLAALVQHGALRRRQLASILSRSPAEIEVDLERVRRRGYVIANPADQEAFLVRSYLLHAITHELRERNMV